MNKRTLPLLILILALMLPVAVSATEATQPDKRIEGYYEIESIPTGWNPLGQLTPEAELVLALTADRLYQLSSDGSTLIPSLAAELPQDVTAEFAGSYNIPESSSRGYAFRIPLDPAARWEDGTPVTAGDLLFTLRQLIDGKTLNIPLANLQRYYQGETTPAGDVISLRDAGFASVQEAEAAGHSAFYVDMGRFWGLDTGWVSVADRSRLKDSAIPSGITEMYVSGAYLYRRYLDTGASLSYYQGEFVGICADSVPVGLDDIGLIEENGSLVLILEEPATAQSLALKLTSLIPLRESKFAQNYGTSPAAYCACGPWRIVSVAEGVMELVPNEFYHGKITGFEGDRIYLKMIGS